MVNWEEGQNGVFLRLREEDIGPRVGRRATQGSRNLLALCGSVPSFKLSGSKKETCQLQVGYVLIYYRGSQCPPEGLWYLTLKGFLLDPFTRQLFSVKSKLLFSNLRAQRPLWVGWGTRVEAKAHCGCPFVFFFPVSLAITARQSCNTALTWD